MITLLIPWEMGVNESATIIRDETMSETTGQDQQQNMQRVAMTSLAGTSIEWYDFFLYGTAAAVIFPKAFFPQDLPTMVLSLIHISEPTRPY